MSSAAPPTVRATAPDGSVIAVPVVAHAEQLVRPLLPGFPPNCRVMIADGDIGLAHINELPHLNNRPVVLPETTLERAYRIVPGHFVAVVARGGGHRAYYNITAAGALREIEAIVAELGVGPGDYEVGAPTAAGDIVVRLGAEPAYPLAVLHHSGTAAFGPLRPGIEREVARIFELPLDGRDHAMACVCGQWVPLAQLTAAAAANPQPFYDVQLSHVALDAAPAAPAQIETVD